MRVTKKKLFLISLLVLCFLTGCEKTVQEEEAIDTLSMATESIQDFSEEKEIVVAVNIDGSATRVIIDNVWFNRSRFIGGLLFQSLLIAEENMNNVEPDLCSEYSISPDGLTYVFHLRNDNYWHDGTKLTMEDIRWSIETSLKAKSINGYLKKGLQKIEGAEEFENGISEELSGVRIEGENLIIKITARDDDFLGGLAQLAILPKHCFEGVKPDNIENSSFWENPIGSGPYKVKERRDKEIVLEKNTDYNGRLPNIDIIRFVILDNPGEDSFDFAMTSDPIMVKKYMEDSSYKVVRSNNLYYRYLMFNIDGKTGKTGELLKNQKIRYALYLGLDRKRIIDEVYQGAAIPINTGIEKDSFWYRVSEDEETNYNPEKARQILEEENFDFSETLVLTHYSHDEISLELINRIVQSWNQLGIQVDVVPIQSTQTDKMWVDTDWYNIGLKNLAAVDYSEWYYEYASSNPLWSKVLSGRTEFDSLVGKLNGSLWAYERKELYEQLQKRELECIYKIPLAIVPQYVIYNHTHLDIPRPEFPNLWYYFDLHIEDWEVREKENLR